MSEQRQQEAREEEDKRMSIENAEVNILYTAAFAFYFIAQDAERRMNAGGTTFGFRRKQLFNGIVKDLQGAKKKQDQLYQDYIAAWKNATHNYEEEQENANSLARLLLLWFDRVEGWDAKEKAVEDFIKSLGPQDAVTEEHLSRFYMKKNIGNL